MAVPTLLTLRTHIRALCLDASTTEPHNTSDEILRLLNEHYEGLWSKEARYSVFRYTSGTLGTNSDAGLKIDPADSSNYEMELVNDYDEIISVHYEGMNIEAGATSEDESTGYLLRHGTILNTVEARDITYMRSNSILAGTFPRYCHVRRNVVSNTGALSAATSKWKIYVHPAPAPVPPNIDKAYFSIMAKKRYAPLVSDSDQPQLHPISCYAMARSVAWELASRQGRSPRFLDTIARMIPQEMRQARGIKLHAQQGVSSVDVE